MTASFIVNEDNKDDSLTYSELNSNMDYMDYTRIIIYLTIKRKTNKNKRGINQG